MRYLLSCIRPYFAHIPDETLADLVSGELSSFRLRMAELHLSRCWQCRTRRAELERAAHAVVAFRKGTLARCMPLEDRHRRSFLARLESADVSPQESENSSVSPFRRFFSHMNPIFASAVVIAIASVLLFLIWQRRVPAVTAGELLERAESSEQEQASEHAAGVVYQQVAITAGKSQICHATYRDIAGKRRQRHAELSNDEQSVYRQLGDAGVDWENPLSARSFRLWREGRPISGDEVRRTARGELTLVTRLRDSAIREESLTVRSEDFHPIRRTIAMRNNDTIEVAELNYAVLGWNAVNESLFEPMQPLHAVPAAVPTVSAIAMPVAPTFAELLDAEVRARVALHTAGADLGESVQVDLGMGNSSVHVQGMLGSSERKQELLAALNDIPHLAIHLQTVDEASQVAVPTMAEVGRVTVVNQQPALESQLMERFPDEEKRRQFVDQTLNAVDLAMAHAWAVRRIEERYPGPQLGPLDPSDRQMLQLMVRDHLAMIEEQVVVVDRSLRMLPGWPSEGPNSDGEALTAEQWRNSMMTMFTDVKTMQEDVRRLLTQSETGSEPTDARMARLQERIVALEDRLPDLTTLASRAY